MKKPIHILILVALVIIIIAGYLAYTWNNPNSGKWERRINAALEPSTCPEVKQVALPASYYQGPLIDTHLHIPPLDDDFFGDIDVFEDRPRGVDSDLYDTVAAKDNPLLGRTVTIDEIACALQQEGTSKAFAFFPVFPDIAVPMVETADRIMSRYPDLFLPFIQASGNEIATVEGDVLQQLLDLKPNLFAGFGETGDSPTEPINPPPDSPIYTGNWQVVQDNDLLVYFHPSPDHHLQLDRTLKAFPNVTFIVHGDFVRPHIDQLLASNPNLYFTANDIFDEATPLFRFGDKEVFMQTMEQDWDMLLAQAVRDYKQLIEKYPDRFM